MTRSEKYKVDQLIEAGVSKFLDEHFYSKLKADVTRWHDKEHQFAGIDVTVKSVNFDEKLKIRGSLNSVLAYPSFEVSLINRGGHQQDGWFTQQLSTDYYAYIGVYSYGTDENAISCPNEISACDVLWVKKQDVVDMVEEQMTIDELKEDADELRNDGYDENDKKRKTYPHRRFWLTYSAWMSEKPVNLVTTRATLEKLPHSKHLIVTRENVRRA